MATKKPRSAAQEAAMREAQEAKDTEAATAAYDKAMPSPERYAKGGKVGSASKRADGCAVRGKTRGMMV